MTNKASKSWPKIKISIVSTVKKSEFLVALFKSVPLDCYIAKEDVFKTEEEGKYDGIGFDSFAVLFCGLDLEGNPALAFYSGTDMTYSTTDKKGMILGGGKCHAH